jgi:ABC-type sugar transport system ATPase subunit
VEVEMQRTPLLRFNGITKVFPGVKALDDVSFEINAGEVHAICGENGAGKSTLINIVAGNYQPDSGSIEIKGKRVSVKSYANAMDMGISVVYQERSLVPNLSVAENIFTDRQPRGFLNFIDKKRMFKDTKKICGDIELDVLPGERVGNLIIAKQQMVEIAKALSIKSQLLILDEPTATITEKETKVLFEVIKNLKERGISIIYISHRLQEIFNIADRVTVLKDGKYIGTRKVEDVEVGDVIRMMVGRDLAVDKSSSKRTGDRVLEVRNLNTSKIKDVSFILKKGEILAFAGLSGAGRTEVARAIIGADPIESGEIFIKGLPVKISNTEDAIENGIGYLPEDRKEHGLFLEMSVAHNVVSGNLKMISRNRLINEKKIIDVSKKSRDQLRIMCPSVGTVVRQLSGGNQQKVVFAKWLLVNSKILIVDEPTRGIDVGTKSEIYRIIRELSSKGTSIIIISSELPEVLTIADRIIVMHNGQITGELMREETTEEEIMHYASGLKQGVNNNR